MIKSAHNTIKRWDRPGYRRIERVRGSWDDGAITVWFEDGSEVRLDLAKVVPDTLVDIDWWRTAANQIEVIVPHAGGWFEIPWDVIRRETDPEFLAHRESTFSAQSESTPQ